MNKDMPKGMSFLQEAMGGYTLERWLIVLAGWNLIVFFLYAMDKYRARRGLWRVPEKTLLLCSLLCGGVGALAAFRGLRHKTRHLSFRILVPLSFLLTVGAAGLLVWQSVQ